MHSLQNQWWQMVMTGVSKVSRQMGHSRSGTVKGEDTHTHTEYSSSSSRGSKKRRQCGATQKHSNRLG